MKFEYNTKISSARPTSKSARTTIPQEIMKFLELKKGDKIIWTVDIESENIKVEISKDK